MKLKLQPWLAHELAAEGTLELVNAVGAHGQEFIPTVPVDVPAEVVGQSRRRVVHLVHEVVYHSSPRGRHVDIAVLHRLRVLFLLDLLALRLLLLLGLALAGQLSSLSLLLLGPLLLLTFLLTLLSLHFLELGLGQLFRS